jgi:predicted phage terminase large subunit-like protein
MKRKPQSRTASSQRAVEPSAATVDAALIKACREDFASFVELCFNLLNPGTPFKSNWHIDALAYRLEQVRLGSTTRLIANLPPRHLKSIITSIAFPAFVLGHDPTKRVISVTYGADLAVKFAHDFRKIVTSPIYRRIFPGMRIARNVETEVMTTEGGFRLATSVDGTLTGWGGDIIIVDDPIKPSDAQSDSKREHVNEWFVNTLLSRLDDKQNGAIILVMQRLHVDDLCGSLLRASDDWTLLKLPAIAEEDEQIHICEDEVHNRLAGDLLHPAREPKSVLDSIRTLFGSYNFAGQYQQRPVPLDGAIINPTWVEERYNQLPPRSTSHRIIQSWDTASKVGSGNHWTVCVTVLIADKKYYVVDVVRGRFDYPTLKARAIALAEEHKANRILIEDTGVGPALIAELRKAGLPVVAIRPEQDKRTRMSIQSSKFESGQVLFPNRARWLPDFEAELFAFPNSRHDDQVDALSQALAYGDKSTGWDENGFKNFDRFVNALCGPPWLRGGY